jgi:phage/plasmid-like protein (TIGR03299 family)
MAHNVETMAYAGSVPWHGLGVRVSNDLTPLQMMQKSGVDWKVTKVPTIAIYDGEMIETGTQALIRESDNSILAPSVGENWEPIQNDEAFNFFNEFCLAGDMEMHTAGSLQNGKIVWVLAKIKESFDVLGKDQVDNYMLFSNPHIYGKSANVRMTPVRVVCNNTLNMSMNMESVNEAVINHRRAFNPDIVKESMGLAHQKFEQYRDAANFLATKRYTQDNLITFLNTVFPAANTKRKVVSEFKELSTTAKKTFEVMDTQPGAELFPGTWWNALNAVTYMTDHQLGRTADTRMQSAWFGSNQTRKLKAVNTAIEFAEAA